jgi:probable RNA-binding protein EIF1AD
MSGLGRRSHYRKHLTDAVLHDFPIPQQDECIAKVVATRGGNQFDVLVDGNSQPQLAILPSKFNKLIWVKRGDYCIVQTGEDSSEEETTSGGVRYLITHILYKDQIKHLKSKKLWPSGKDFETAEGGTDDDRKQQGGEEAKWTSDEEDEQEDGIVYDTGIDDEYFVNTNRVNVMEIQESSESESSDDGDIQQQGTDEDGIVYDTQDDELFADTNRVAALRIEDSESESSEEEKEEEKHVKESQHQDRDGLMRQETSDSLVYDTGDATEVDDPHNAEIAKAETSDSLIYDTGVDPNNGLDGTSDSL